MNPRRKRPTKRPSPPPKNDTPSSDSPIISSRQDSPRLESIGRALDECVGAVCLLEVTLRSLESREIGSPEQEVLKRALKSIWYVHDWVYEFTPNDLDAASSSREGEP